MKKFNTKINKFYFIAFAVLIVLHILAIVDESPENEIRYNPRYTIWFVLIGLFVSTRTIVFTKEHIIVRYLYIPVRRISASRVSSIEFVMQQGVLYLVVCLDDHLPISESYKKLKPFMVSSKMIVISVPDKKREEYVIEMKQLYSNVSFVNWK